MERVLRWYAQAVVLAMLAYVLAVNYLFFRLSRARQDLDNKE